jgi:predicted nucleotide-binding protein
MIAHPSEPHPRTDSDETISFAANRKAVMVIYGHDIEAKDALFGWLRTVGLQPREWSQLVSASGSASPYIGQVLEYAFQQVQAVIVLFTPDEHVHGRDALPSVSSTWRLQARPNVLFEAGMALIAHPNRTVIVTLGPQELPSDLAGRHYVRLNRTAGPLNDMANRLQAAGCEVDKSGTDWLDPTRFPDRDTIASSPPTHSAGAGQRTVDQTPAEDPPGSQRETPPLESLAPFTMADDESSTVSGEGVYLVGLDIQPGVYRTTGPADRNGMCYYALLSSTNTSDIINNNNVGGPATITIGPDVKAVHFSGCKPWHRLDIEA